MEEELEVEQTADCLECDNRLDPEPDDFKNPIDRSFCSKRCFIPDSRFYLFNRYNLLPCADCDGEPCKHFKPKPKTLH